MLCRSSEKLLNMVIFLEEVVQIQKTLKNLMNFTQKFSMT
jgi:hypothetical protein